MEKENQIIDTHLIIRVGLQHECPCCKETSGLGLFVAIHLMDHTLSGIGKTKEEAYHNMMDNFYNKHNG